MEPLGEWQLDNAISQSYADARSSREKTVVHMGIRNSSLILALE